VGELTSWECVVKRAAVVVVLILLGVLARPAPAAAATTICSVFCDTRDPSPARQETFPVADRVHSPTRCTTPAG
jgi:hypothetical protein